MLSFLNTPRKSPMSIVTHSEVRKALVERTMQPPSSICAVMKVNDGFAVSFREASIVYSGRSRVEEKKESTVIKNRSARNGDRTQQIACESAEDHFDSKH